MVEDESGIAECLRLPLERSYGHSLTHCSTLRDAMRAFEKGGFDAILLDLNLPDGNGIDFCRTIREKSLIPILMLTARRDEVDRILGLEIGADDYIVKPFSPREVGARINAVLRRKKWALGQDDDSVMRHGGIVINESRMEVLVRERPVRLTKTEYNLLVTLMRRPGQVYSRAQLVDMVWEGNFIIDRVVDSVVSRLRRKLGRMDGEREWIRTVHGTGYCMNDCP